MLGPYDNYVYVSNPHDHEDGGMGLPLGWALPNNSEIMQNQNSSNGLLSCCTEPHPPILPESYFAISKLNEWDIKDAILPNVDFNNKFEIWPNGDCKFVYCADNIKARKHKCGWAMRNTNNHNKMILKKSCLGIIKCSKDCLYPDKNSKLVLAPKISEGARRCQLNNKCCPNPNCGGTLVQQTCKGKSGNPVTHYWRYHPQSNNIYFMAKGTHDHSKPISLVKTSDRKIKSKDAEDNAQFQYSFENKHDFKNGSLNIEMNEWNESLLSISNDYGNCSFIMNPYLPFTTNSAMDLININPDRHVQSNNSTISFMKVGQPIEDLYPSMGDEVNVTTSKYSPAFIQDFSENTLTSLQERPYLFSSLQREIHSILENDDDLTMLQNQWSTDYVSCDLLQPQNVSYTDSLTTGRNNLRFLSNNPIKQFGYHIE